MTTTPADRLNLVDVDLDDGDSIDDSPERRLFFAGDCIYRDNLADDPIGDDLRERIAAADHALVNLEAPIPGDGDPIAKSGPAKASDPAAPQLLADTGFDVACLANNHIMDHGEGGLTATLDACNDAGLQTVGAGESQQAALDPLELSLENTSVAVVNVCEREFGVAERDTPGTAWASHRSTERRIAEANADTDVVVVVAHGGVEFTPLPPQQRQAQLRGFVDAGADAVVGHHPHVAQGWEEYDGSPVYYSLGNFLFDQSNRPNTKWGLCVELTLRGDTITGVDLLPTELVDGVVDVMGRDRDVDDHLDYLHRVSEITADRERLHAYWQEIAVRLFEQRYSNWLRAGTASGPLQLLKDPKAALGDDVWGAEERRTELLTLLNVVRNESHRDAIETALAVQTGDVRDRRTPEIRRDVRELFAWTEDQQLYDLPSSRQRTVKAVLGQFR
ncbi:poly-gamma-glutamate synthesis protein (capsule biosynthesis protein) [Halogranum amylolyticum]|uniref:Poly-gamma-glutamate synthesis protein (Capsule biosynthesis protein) n=1 Tax=Halogranum amylolyticum TaxID=660520 RepID=A0A1H8W443_9EURY|nr:CapA family protein [Halogranum amylolyticum]SEP22384.1 poly-gamma-glutamate synthesis protein (capsule biosynthesis protein) [Halogranum amylolyticum]